MQRPLTTLFAFTVVLFGCTSAPKQQSITDPLDGTWEQVAHDCESGNLTADGIKYNARIANGTLSSVYRVSGSEVEIKSEAQDWKYLTSEQWVRNGATIEVSDSRTTTTHYPQGAAPDCTPCLNLPPRTHQFKIVGKVLQIVLSPTYHFALSGPYTPMCDKGREVLVFTRSSQR